MDKLSRIIRTKKFLYWSIFIVTVFLFVGFFWLIYHKDQPKVIPPETRGEIREGIKEEIVKPVQSVWPKGGQVLADAAFGGSTGTAITNSVSSSAVSDASAWKTYRDENLGIEFKYPEVWSLTNVTNQMRTEGSLNINATDSIILDPMASNKETARFSLEKRKSIGIENDTESVFSDTEINYKEEYSLSGAGKAYLVKGTAYKFASDEVLSNFKALIATKNNEVFILQYVKKVNEADLTNYFDDILYSFKINN
jgi:hypothetical protein